MEKFNKTMKIILSVLYVLITGLLIYALIDGYYDELNSADSMNAYGLVVAFIVLIIGGISFAVVSVISLIMLIIGLFRKDSVKFYVYGFFLPIITELILVIIGFILNSNFNS